MKPPSPAQHPEKLYREGWFLASLVAVTLFMDLFMVVDMPWLHWFLHRPFKTK